MVSTLAMIILGVYALGQLPVSLMPDIPIPEITVQVKSNQYAARELENLAIKPLRERLLTLPNLVRIESRTQEGSGEIFLKFGLGTRMDFTFLEVSERVDQAMGILPRDLNRPLVIKASATDIPVFFLNLTLKDSINGAYQENQLMELGAFATEVVRRRLEQLPEVALVDVSGKLNPEIQIIPDQDKMAALGFELADLKQALKANNMEMGNLLVKEGQYQYYIHFSSTLDKVDALGEIFIKSGERIMPLKELADIRMGTQNPQGLYLFNGQPALGLAIIKEPQATMAALRKEVNTIIERLGKEHPDLQFNLSQDQTELLNVSMLGLQQSLLIGTVMAFLVLFLFLKDKKAPFLIGITIPVALILTMLFLYLMNISLNLVSLSGLILGIGLMIDNAIIVIDSITQLRRSGHSISDACSKGTNEIIKPLIASALTTCAVFIPLIFLSGIAGALFYDQAIAITFGLVTSLLVSVTFLPTLYRLVYPQKEKTKTKWIEPWYQKKYENALNYLLNRPWQLLFSCFALVGLGVWLFTVLPLRRLPHLDRQDVLLKIDWNERIALDESQRRVNFLLKQCGPLVDHSDAQLGIQQFLLQHDKGQQMDQVSIYLHASSKEDLFSIIRILHANFRSSFPKTNFFFLPPPNVLDRLFGDNRPYFEVQISQEQLSPPLDQAESIRAILSEQLGLSFQPIATQIVSEVVIDKEQLIRYEVNEEVLIEVLETAFQANEADQIRNNREILPVVLQGKPQTVENILKRTLVPNKEGLMIPLRALVSLRLRREYAELIGGDAGEYVPLVADSLPSIPSLISSISSVLAAQERLNFHFSGNFFENRRTFKELAMVLAIATLLLYFILAAQFESLTLPLIVLIEIPIDISGSLFMLRLFDSSLNLLSLIGIIVMSGIIINDSILKIDAMNRLRMAGWPLRKAIKEGGRRRLTPIIMTSLTTVLAVVPFLFQESLGAVLQKPLALALIGGMILGTIVSLFFIPVAYWALFNKSKEL